MNVSLTPELEAFIEETVKSGRYASASEAVREGLRLLGEREAKFMALKRDIERGMESPVAGVFDGPGVVSGRITATVLRAHPASRLPFSLAPRYKALFGQSSNARAARGARGGSA